MPDDSNIPIQENFNMELETGFSDSGDEYIYPTAEANIPIDHTSPLQQELTNIVNNHIDSQIRHKMGCGCPQCKTEATNIVEYKAHPYTITREHAKEVAVYMHKYPNEVVVFKPIAEVKPIAPSLPNILPEEPHLHE